MNDETPPPDEARRGWTSDFDRFAATPAAAVVSRLKTFISDASLQQIRAWNESIPMLQHEIGEVREVREQAAHYSALLEYQLPLESRRTDAILLLSDAVIVIELKGKTHP